MSTTINQLSPEEKRALLAEMLQRKIAATKQAEAATTLPPIQPVPRSGPLPASFAQQRLWFLTQLDPAASRAYHLPLELQLRGPLDHAALQRSLDAVVARHEALRTVFADGAGQPMQQILPPAPVPLAVAQLPPLPEPQRTAWLRDWRDAQVSAPFDLTQGPLFRASLVQLAPAEHLLVLTLHHIITDGWSLGVMVQELVTAYTLATQGRPIMLPPLPIQYADFAVAQRQWLHGATLERHLAYWRRHLADLAPLQLPTDYPRPAVQRYRGAQLPVQLDAALTARLTELSRQTGGTLFMTLLAAFAVLLSRYSGQTDIAIGTPIANRVRAELEGLLGLFANTLVLRNDLRGNPSFRTLLERVRQVALAAYTHQDLPFERLVEELQPERDLSRSPLFQVLFVLQNTPTMVYRDGVMQISYVPAESGTAKFDLTLALTEKPEGLSGYLEYSSDLFAAATVQRMWSHFTVLLEAVVTNPDLPIAALPLLTPAERQQLLLEWNPVLPSAPLAAVHELYAAQVARTPDALAVVMGEVQLSYAALDRRANQLAHVLRRLGVGPDQPVALLLPRSPLQILAVLAIWKAGGAYLPLDPTLPPGRIDLILRDAQARVLLTTEEHPAVDHDWGTPWQRVLLHERSWFVAEPVDAPPSWEHPDQLAYLIYTSGSTGVPKGVMVAQRGLANLLAALDQTIYRPLGAAPQRVSLNGPLSFDTSVKQLIQLSQGQTLCLIPEDLRRDGPALRAYLARVGVTVLDCTPAHLQLLQAAAPALDQSWPVRAVLLGGEAIPPDLWQRLAAEPQCAYYNLYGPTEGTVDATLGRIRGGEPTLGQPLSNTPVYVLDAQLQPVPIGVPGELCIGGVQVARGYLNRPDLTAERFVPDPFSATPGARLYRSGDVARWRVSGEIEYLGRIDQQIKLRGFRIELGEIEAALVQHPVVQQGVVLLREDRLGEKRLVAYLVASPDQHPADPASLVAEVRTFLATRLPEYMLPSAFVVLDALPLTPNGKVHRQALPAPDLETVSSAQYVAPRTPLEQQLAQIWTEVLGRERISVHDDFFALGGHSLLATQVVARLRAVVQRAVPVRLLFTHPTLADLALALSTTDGHPSPAAQLPPLLPQVRPAQLPLSFAQERLWFLEQLTPGSVAYHIPIAMRVEGPLDQAALERSLSTLITRHESLRTTFTTVDNTLVQVIQPPAPLTMPLIDLSALPPEERLAAAEEQAATLNQQPFDLVHGPLLRAYRIRLAAADHLVLLVLHHLIFDGWSMGVFLQELQQCYAAEIQGQPPELPALPVQYADYTLWQRQWWQGEFRAQHLAYWQQQLHAPLPVLDLPSDFPRPPQPSQRGATLRQHYPPALLARLTALSQQEGVTLFMTLLAAFKVLLYRYSGQRDLIVGVPSANRDQVALEGLLGLCVNTLALRTKLEGQPTFREVLAQVREVTLGAYAHQHAPFEQVVDVVQPLRDTSRSPLFSVLFALQNAPLPSLSRDDLRLSAWPVAVQTARMDLTLMLRETADGLTVDLEYSCDLFTVATMQRLLAHYQTLLAAIVDNPTERISRLPLLTPVERQQLREWNATELIQPVGAGIHELCAAQAVRTPDTIALVTEEGQLSYAALDRRANQLAHYLQALGVGPEVRVGLCYDRSAALIIAALAVLKAGGAYLPMDPAYPAERLATIIDTAAVQLVLAPAHLRGLLPTETVPVLCLATDAPRWADCPLTPPVIPTQPANLAYVIYTSGSTGTPKGVAISHQSLQNLIMWHQQAFAIAPSDRASLLAGVGFDASVWEIWPYLSAGATLCIGDPAARLDPDLLQAWLGAEAITVCFVPTPVAELLVARPWASYGNLRAMLTGGDLLRRGPLPELPFALINNYGPSEYTVVTSSGLVPPLADSAVLPSIGRPIANTRIYLLDAEGQPVPVGVPGELHIGGLGLARGYLHRPDLTAERFVPDPFSSTPGARLYRSGDVVRWRSDGTLEFVGRIDQQVKIRGYRIELGEIEAVLSQHPAVEQGVVLLREDRLGEKRLVAYLVASPDQHPADTATLVAEVRTFLAARLPDYMLPSAFVQLDAIPLTPNGKVHRQALPAPDLEQVSTAQYVAPRTPLEQQLAQIWAEVLGVERVGIDDNFFTLGGHSLLATQVVARLRAVVQRAVPVRLLFTHPTLAELAVALSTTEVQALPAALLPPLLPQVRPAQLPLSFAQERLWFLEQLTPGSVAYHIPIAMRVEGPLDQQVLERSLSTLITRHESLRTTFTTVNNTPVQVIQPPAPLTMPLIDLSALPPEERLAAAQAQAATLNQQPFDLVHGPLLRAYRIRLAAADHLVLLVLHHLIFDGWSMGVFLHELQQCYAAEIQGQPPELPALPVQYADYTLWQRQWWQGEFRDQHLAYWQQQLHAPLPVLDLPSDFPRPPQPSQRGATLRQHYPPALRAQLNVLSQQEGVTLFMTLLAAFKVLLSRYSGQRDLIVGVPIANRDQVALEGLVGLCINTLALRTKLEGQPTFREVLGHVREVTLGAYAHQHAPFEQVVDVVQPLRDTSRSPLFSVLFALQNAPLPSLSRDDLRLSAWPVAGRTARVDLMVTLRETVEGLTVDLEYSCDLFTAATMERLLTHYQLLLEAVVANPQQPISRLPLLTLAERQQLWEWNANTVDYPAVGLSDLVTAQATRMPQAIALRSTTTELTYHALETYANQLAQHLRGLGVGPEVPVGICLPRTPELLVAILAVLKAGGVYIPLDPAYPAERLAWIIADAQPILVLSNDDLVPQLPDPQRVREQYSPHGANTAPAIRYLSVSLRAWERFANEPAQPPVSGVGAENLAYVIYTSGSTGRPKGVAITQRSAVAFLAWVHTVFTPAQLQGVLASTSICFDLSIFEFFAPLSCGGTVILAHDALHLAAHPARTGVTLLNTVPSAATALLELNGLPPTLQVINLAGEPLPLALVQALYAHTRVAQIYNLYGPSEDTTYSTYALMPRSLAQTPSIGRPIANTQIYILDAWGQPVPIGVPGEIYLGGAGLARGYLQRPDLTAERFVPDPFGVTGGARLYKTGDLARYRADGSLEFLGRIDQQVKIRGFRIELGEIETVLGQHPRVREVVVVARAERAGAQQLVAYVGIPAEERAVGPTPDHTVDEAQAALVAELRAFLADRLPAYMLPAAFMLLDRLPRSANGKIDRKALPAPDFSLAHDQQYVAPRTPLEARLAQIWAEVLGQAHEGIGVTDNFFALGGHSLLATQVVARIRQIFNVELPVRSVFAQPTIAELAVTLAQQSPNQAAVPLRPAPRDNHIPLSFAQQRLWFVDQLTPGLSTYNIPIALRLQGRLDEAAFWQSLDTIYQRHEALRTTFGAVEEQPVQIIAPAGPFPRTVMDLSAMPAEAREAEAQRLLHEAARQPFDLRAGPLARVLLIRLSPTDYLALLTMHHIIADGWSLSVLTNELAALYQAFVTNTPYQLPELPIQYADFAIWQRQWFDGAVLDRQLAYWKRQLSGTLPVLNIPTDHARPPVQSTRGASYSFGLDPALSAALYTLSQREGTTLFMTLLTGFVILLHRYSRQDDIIIGSPIANRTHQELESLIGFFVNTLALRCDLSGTPTVRTLLAQVREVTLDAYAHQDLPFERLVEELQPTRDLSRPPLFQVMFVLQNTPQTTISVPGLTLTTQNVVTGTAKFDLLLAMSETPDRKEVRGDLEFSTDLFERATIERMVGHFQTLLAGMVADLDRPITQVPLLSAAERRQLVDEWNQTSVPYPVTTVPQLFTQQVARTPDAIAVVMGDVQLSYAALERRANQLAHALQRLGVGPDTAVGVYLPRSVELVLALLAILKAGGAYLPLDPLYPAERLAFMASDANIQVLLVNAELPSWQPNNLVTVRLALTDWASFAQEPVDAPSTQVQPDNLAYLIYTSGSTGWPKGVAMPHRALVNLLAWHGRGADLAGSARTLQFTTPSFDVAFQEIFTTWAAGGALVLIPEEVRRDPFQLLDVLATQAVERLFVPFVALQQLADASALHQRVPAQLRQVITAGEQLHITPALAAWMDQVHGTLHNHYGPSESHVVTALTLRGAAAAWPVLPPIGCPIDNTRIYLLDSELQPVPVGVAGELYIGGVCLARGYLDRPDLTAARFIPDPFAHEPGARMYCTGDLARMHASGVIEFLGRIDQQVKVRGYRIELGEIEAVLARHPAVQQGIVLLREDRPGEKQLVAYVVTSPDQHPVTDTATLVAELRTLLKEQLPDYMLPAAFVLVQALPLTPSGKVDRKALPAPEPSEIERHHSFIAPRTVTEYQLARIWEELLGVQPVGIHDNFFRLGGHSLLVVRLMARIRQQFGQNVPLTTLFAEPTIAHLARALARPSAAAALSPLVGLQSTGQRLPFFCVHPGGGTVLCYTELSRHLPPDQPFYAFQSVGLYDDQPPLDRVEAMAERYIAALREVQAEGPYLLGGWSFGGLVAVEMARQLTAQGETIALLVLLDSWAPNPNGAELDEVALMVRFADDLGRLMNKDLAIDPAELSTLDTPARLQLVLERAVALHIIPPDISPLHLQRAIAVFLSNMQAMRDYRPQPYSGDLILFRASDDATAEWADPYLGWRSYVQGTVTLYPVPGDHYTMVQAPHVSCIATRLQEHIEESTTQFVATDRVRKIHI